MAEWFDAIDNSILEKFDVPGFDVKAERAKVAQTVRTALSQILKKKRGNNGLWFVGAKPNQIKFELEYRNESLLVHLPDGSEHPSIGFLSTDAETVLTGLADFIEQSDAYDVDLEDIWETGEPHHVKDDRSGGKSFEGAKRAKRKPGTSSADPNHPKHTDPKWSTYTPGEKIQKGLAYKRENA